ncbi:hypothetical protein AA0481_0742 [Acetobacter orientalis NRIC 0481]|nr:hypothetical protein AA0481_0742 [Acetobacter orientalis NRIC 0481]
MKPRPTMKTTPKTRAWAATVATTTAKARATMKAAAPKPATRVSKSALGQHRGRGQKRKPRKATF